MTVDRSSQHPRGPWPGLVVGVDGSAPSQRALEWALGIAPRLGVGVLALQVSDDVYTAAEKGFCTRGQAEEWTAQARSDGLTMLSRQLDELGYEPGEPEVELEVVPGQPAEVLLRRSSAAEMLVLGPRGLGRLRQVLGSVSRTCLQHATCPVVIVPDTDGERRG